MCLHAHINIYAHTKINTHAYTEREVSFHISGQKWTQITGLLCGRKNGGRRRVGFQVHFPKRNRNPDK